MNFAIGMVQDAGLIFLSSMSNTIADIMIEDGESEKAIVSTAMVILSLGTAVLGLVLFVIGKFKLANIVAYLPMPVIGGEHNPRAFSMMCQRVLASLFWTCRVSCLHWLLLRSSRCCLVHITSNG